MTLENSRKLYDHFLSISMTEEAEQLLREYPSLKKIEKEIAEDEKPKKIVKKKAKK